MNIPSRLFGLWLCIVQFGFHLLYNQLAWTYEGVAWLVSLGEWAKWRRAAIPFVRGGRVLELAHGTGHLLGSLREAGYGVVGMDLSPFMGRIARRHTKGQVPMVQGRGEKIPFADNIFDTVVVTFPTPFIIERETLSSLARILADEGRVVIVPTGMLKGSGLVERVIAWAFAVTGQRNADDGLQQWQTRFTEFGFDVRVEKVDLGRSWVFVLVGRKRGAHFTNT